LSNGVGMQLCFDNYESMTKNYTEDAAGLRMSA